MFLGCHFYRGSCSAELGSGRNLRSTKMPFSMNVETLSSSSSSTCMGFSGRLEVGALKLKLIMEEWSVSMQSDVYSRSNSTGKNVD